MKVFEVAQTNGEAWQKIDRATIAAMNVVFREAYPAYTLKDFANPLTQPLNPENGDCYLVDKNSACWGLNVTSKQIIARVAGAWTILPETIDSLYNRIAVNIPGERLLGTMAANGSPTGNEIAGDYYEASAAGVYANFGGITVKLYDKIKKSVAGVWIAETKVSPPYILYVAYSSDANGTGFSLTPTDALKYRAEIFTTAVINPAPADFAGKWIKYIGDVTAADLALKVNKADYNFEVFGKLDKIVGKNILNPNDPNVLHNKYIGATGTINTPVSGVFDITGPISIAVGQTLKGNFTVANTFAALFTAEGAFIPGTAVNAAQITNNTSAKAYARFTINGGFSAGNWQVENGNVSTAYEAYTEYKPLVDAKAALQANIDASTASISSKLDKQVGKNLLNPNASGVQINRYISPSGVIEVPIVENALSVTGPIPIEAGQTLTGNFTVYVGYAALYTKEGEYIAGTAVNSNTITNNTGFKAYARFSVVGAIAGMDRQVENGNVSTAYEAYTEYKPLNDAIAALQNSLNTINVSGKLDKIFGKNLFNTNDQNIVTGNVNYTGAFIKSNGAIVSNQYTAAYIVSGWIPVTENQSIIISPTLTNNVGAALYDANFTFIPGTYIQYDLNGCVLPFATGAKWARFTILLSLKNSTQIEVGSVATPYEAYTEFAPLGLLKELNPDRKAEAILPNKMYFLKGKQSCIYYENVLFKNLNDPTTLYFDKGVNYNRQVTFNFATAAVNQTLKAQVIRNFKKGLLKTISYDVIDPATNAGKTINVLHIGDSFTDIGIWVKECKTLLNAQGVTYNLIGTCGNSTFKAEGLSGGRLANTFIDNSQGVARIVEVAGMVTLPSTGHPGQTYTDANGNQWTIRGGKIDGSGNGHIRVTKLSGATEASFATFPTSGILTKTSSGEGDAIINYSNPIPAYFNPFLNHATGVLDIVNYINFWGFANPDIFAFQFTWNDLGDWAIDTTINSLVASFKTAADHIHAAYQNAKVIYSIEPMGSPNGNRDWNGKKYSVLRFTELMLAQFEANANYNTWVKIAPSFAFVDLINGYSATTVIPCERFAAITEVSGGDGIHPQTGMYQIADCVAPIISSLI